MAIAFQATLSGRVSNLVGPIRTGLLVNAAGGSIALVVLLSMSLNGRLGIGSPSNASGPILIPLAVAGILGILIIMGVSFSVRSLGVTAGLAAVILTQLVGGLLLDRTGLISGAGIAVDPRRILGVLAMSIGVWLLIPRTV